MTISDNTILALATGLGVVYLIGRVMFEIGYHVCFTRVVHGVFDSWIARAAADEDDVDVLARVWQDFKRATGRRRSTRRLVDRYSVRMRTEVEP